LNSKILLSLIILSISNTLFSQENYWIFEYDLIKDSYRNDYFKSYKDYNTAIFKQTKDSLLIYVPGKYGIEEAFKNGFRYKQKNDSLFIENPRRNTYGYISKDTLKLFSRDEKTPIFRRVKTNKKFKVKKLHKLIDGNNFYINRSKIDRIISNNGIEKVTLKKYDKSVDINSEKNVFYEIIELGKSHFFISFINLGKAQLHPIINYNKKGFTIFSPNKKNNYVTFKNK